MSKQRHDDPWMPGARYGASLRGLSLNLLVRDIAAAVEFQQQVLHARIIYADPDIAVMDYNAAQWMLHADHTYDGHPLYPSLGEERNRGLGCEIRLHDHDPDAAETRARVAGYEVVQSTADKAHGLRECFIRDADGYLWVPDRPLSERP